MLSIKNRIFIEKLIRLLVGLVIMSFGIVLYLKSGYGANPLTAFTEGVAKTLNISVGQSSQLVMIITMVLVYLVDRRRIGIGTIINAILTGFLIDWFMNMNIDNIGTAGNVMILIIGIFIFAVGLAMYVGAGLGEGAVDAIMVIITDKTRINLSISRVILDIGLVLLAWILGGTIGLGTIAGMILTGPIMNYYLKITLKWRKKND